ncbi:hypothetical protein L6164_031351 [Bauhinia variegata]|uniref:Uncharacterized protein n=1 Tax=Bauhinia variegata TaxID=167791 RepID=A0ACB9LFL3_BAUVA|nr:hypothetical protein L6164_031351 [Bauhinia variegata]
MILIHRTLSFLHAPVFGLSGALGFDDITSQRAHMFVTMREVISAASRLDFGQTLVAAVLQHHIAEAILEKRMSRAVLEACQTAVISDNVQGCHGYLSSSDAVACYPSTVESGKFTLLCEASLTRFLPL